MSVEELQRRPVPSKAAVAAVATAPVVAASRNVKEIPQPAACLHFLHLIFMQYLSTRNFLLAALVCVCVCDIISTRAGKTPKFSRRVKYELYHQ